MKICLGTANFGQKYGLNYGQQFKNLNEIKKIINYCINANIKFLDTSIDYGNTLSRLSKCDLSKFKIISKVTVINNNINTFSKNLDLQIQNTFELLGVNKIYSILLQRPEHILKFKNTDINKLFSNLKKKYNIKKIGFSFYDQNLLKLLINKIDMDIVQIPYNIFDNRFEKVMIQMNKLDIEIHSRSVFLQGVLLKKKENLNSYFMKWSKHFDLYNEWLVKNKYQPLEFCLNYVKKNININKIVIGVDSIDQLDQIVNSIYKKNIIMSDKLFINDEKILMPKLWKLKKN
jgi:aryl-alcohol dehydrogenase-like predicted oxidoreductase|tara:strand:- start:6590 stop:7456 length:867 start_codon:yes stop_codon:yes gene_type:complete